MRRPGSRRWGRNLYRLVARALHGLETLVANEITTQRHGIVDRIGHREVHLTVPMIPDTNPFLRTADDILVLVAIIDDIGHTRSSLHHLENSLDQVDFERHISTGTNFDVSASFVGARTYNRFDIEDTVGQCIARRTGLSYHSRRNGNRPPDTAYSWRVTIDGSRATIGLRLTTRHAHRRQYKRATVAGTTHPPLAAAMARLADLRPGHSLADPCCGAGTLLIESSFIESDTRLFGIDVQQPSLAIARKNAAGIPAMWINGDAGRLPLTDESIDRMVVNPPWNRQVVAMDSLATGNGRLWREARRVLTEDCRLVAVIHHDDSVDGVRDIERSGFVVIALHEIRLFGANARIVVGK